MMRKRIRPVFVRAKKLTEAQEKVPFEGWWQKFKNGWLYSPIFIGDMSKSYGNG